MGIKDDINEIRNEVQEVKEQSFAMELLHDSRKTNKRMFIIILVILIMWFLTIAYLVYILNDIGTIETSTQEVQQESESGNNNFVGGNGDINNGKTNDKTNKN